MSDLTVVNNWYPNRRNNLPIGGATYVSKTGSDATGQAGNVGRPYLTLAAAKAAVNAAGGGTVIVWPGVYNENNLFKDGVNWFFMPGARVEYTFPQVALGIIDPAGATNAVAFTRKIAGVSENGIVVQYVDDGSQVGNTASASYSSATRVVTIKVKTTVTTAQTVVTEVNAGVNAATLPVIAGFPGSAGGNGSGTVTAPLSVTLAGGAGVVTSTSDYGIFDDRDGAGTVTVGGDGVFKSIDATKNTDLAATVNANAQGTIYIKQSGTNFNLEGKQILTDVWGNNGLIMIRIENCAFCYFDLDEIKDLNNGATATDNGAVGNGQDNTLKGSGIGMFWTTGETYLRFDRCIGGQYGVWMGMNTNGAANTNFWCDGNHCESAAAAVYWSEGASTNWRTWVHIKECLSGTGNTNFISGGRHYFQSDKVSSTTNGNSLNIAGYLANVPTIWFNLQKVSGGAGATAIIVFQAGIVFGEILQVEDLGSATIGIDVNNANADVHLTGGYMKILNGIGIRHTSGSSDFNGMKIDTSNTNNAANDSILVAGAGLKIRNLVLISGALAQCVDAAAAQTITNYGSVGRTAKGANVTVNVQAILVDANVV